MWEAFAPWNGCLLLGFSLRFDLTALLFSSLFALASFLAFSVFSRLKGRRQLDLLGKPGQSPTHSSLWPLEFYSARWSLPYLLSVGWLFLLRHFPQLPVSNFLQIDLLNSNCSSFQHLENLYSGLVYCLGSFLLFALRNSISKNCSLSALFCCIATIVFMSLAHSGDTLYPRSPETALGLLFRLLWFLELPGITALELLTCLILRYNSSFNTEMLVAKLYCFLYDPTLAIRRKRMRIVIKRREKTCARMCALCTKWWQLLPPDLKW